MRPQHHYERSHPILSHQSNQTLPPDPVTGKRPPIYVLEDAPWSAVRNVAHPYGFAAFTVDPGTRQGGVTTMSVTYYDVVGTEGQLEPFESFTLQRPRSDAHNS
jgi:hypothetical protein